MQKVVLHLVAVFHHPKGVTTIAMLKYTRPVAHLRWRIEPRFYSTNPEKLPSPEKKLSPDQARAEAAKVHIQTLKDMGSLFSSGSSDDATQPIDTEPVFKNPKIFGTLSLLHQGQVLKELQDKYDQSWKKLTDVDKKLGYYIAYGDWGVREKFTNWNTLEAPLDLPFRVPSQIRTASPKPTDIIKKLEPVILAETPVRREQFDTKKMDPVTKTFIYITIFIALLAIARDKKIGEGGKPEEIEIEDIYENQRQKQEKFDQQPAPQEQQPRPGKKWYYLWLK